MTQPDNQEATRSINCSICNMIDKGFFGQEDINEWLVHSYSGKMTPPLSIQELTNLLNNRILATKLKEKYSLKEYPFDLDTLRQYIISMFIEKEKIDERTYTVGSNIIKLYNLKPRNLSGFLINTSQMKIHLNECLVIEQNRDEKPKTIGEAIEKTVTFGKTIIDASLEQGKRKGIIDPDEELEVFLFNKRTGERRPIEVVYTLE